MLAAYRRYVAHPDPLVAASNTIAMVIAGNQPSYPLYMLWIAGPASSPVWWALLSAPFFAIIPWVARRSSLLGRALLPLFGIANTVLTIRLLGEAAGLQLYLLPAAVIAAMAFRANERWVMLGIVAVAVAAYALLDGHYPPPPHALTEAAYASIRRLNAITVGTLIGVLGLVYARPAAA